MIKKILARFDSQCWDCHGKVITGEKIHFDTELHSVYHAACFAKSGASEDIWAAQPAKPKQEKRKQPKPIVQHERRPKKPKAKPKEPQYHLGTLTIMDIAPEIKAFIEGCALRGFDVSKITKVGKTQLVELIENYAKGGEIPF